MMKFNTASTEVSIYHEMKKTTFLQHFLSLHVSLYDVFVWVDPKTREGLRRLMCMLLLENMVHTTHHILLLMLISSWK